MGRDIHYCRCGSEIFDEMEMCRRCSLAASHGSAHVTAGRYTLRPFHGNSLWLEHEDGEGMQIWGYQLDEILHKYFKKHF